MAMQNQNIEKSQNYTTPLWYTLNISNYEVERPILTGSISIKSVL